MASSPASARQQPNPFREESSIVLRIRDTSPDTETLATYPWQECSKIIVRIDPPYDSPALSQAHLVDLKNGPKYMTALLNRTKEASSILKGLLQEHINAGQTEIQIIFEEC